MGMPSGPIFPPSFLYELEFTWKGYLGLGPICQYIPKKIIELQIAEGGNIRCKSAKFANGTCKIHFFVKGNLDLRGEGETKLQGALYSFIESSEKREVGTARELWVIKKK